tara:strand:+ start:6574 stop:7167 length:594 start_codon:yes stop_codon:yes gene_type:complete
VNYLARFKAHLKKNWTKILKDLITLIVGLISAYWSVLKYGDEKERANGYEIIIYEKEDELDRKQEIIDSLLLENQEKDLLISEIMVKVSIDSYDIEYVPFPMGYKVFDKETRLFRMVRVNNAYKRKYSVSNAKYFGKQDETIDYVYGTQWYRNDLVVIKGLPMVAHRFYEDSSKGIFSWRKWKVVKDEVEYLYFIEI